MRRVVLVLLPPGSQRAVFGDVECCHDPVAAVIADGDPPLGVDQRRVGDQSARQAADLGEGDGCRVEVHPDQVERSGRDPLAFEGSVEADGAVAVVEEPGSTQGEHAVPAVGLAIHGPVGGTEPLVGHEVTVLPGHAQQAGVPDHVDIGSDRRQAGDGRFGQLAGIEDCQGVRVEGDQLARTALLGRQHRRGPGSGEVFGDECAVGKDDEPVVGDRPGKLAGGQDLEVGPESMGMVAEHHMQGAVAVSGQTSWPHGPTGQVDRSGQDLEGVRIDALDDGHGLVAHGVAQQEDFAGLSGDGHGDQGVGARQHIDAGCGSHGGQGRSSSRRLQASRATVFGWPRTRPVRGEAGVWGHAWAPVETICGCITPVPRGPAVLPEPRAVNPTGRPPSRREGDACPGRPSG